MTTSLARCRLGAIAAEFLIRSTSTPEPPPQDAKTDADAETVASPLRNEADVVAAQLAAIVASSDDAIVSKTLDGVIRSWNAAATRLFGYTADEVIGKHITLLIPPARLDEEATILDRLRRGERVEHFETIRVTKDGRSLNISLTVSPIKDRHGRVVGASKIARDITQQKHAEASLRESEARHRFLANLADATQPLTDADKVMATTARLLAEHLNADRCAYAEIEDEATFIITGDHTRGVPSIVGRWPIAAFGPECERCMRENLPFVVDDTATDPRVALHQKAYEDTTIRAVICVPLHKTGRLAAAMAVHKATPRRWAPAEVALVTTVLERSWESIERARIGRGLKEAAERLALAFEAARLGDWSWDALSDVVTFSPRAAEIFGIPPGPHMTWTAMQQQMLHSDDRERTLAAVQRSISTRERYEMEYRVLRPDGVEVWVSATGRALYARSGFASGMFGVVQDITEKKRLEQELRRRAAELAASDQQKDEFIALLAHELRNPLAPIRTGLQVLRLAADDPQALSRARAIMERQLGHMVRLIDDLLDVSRLSRNKLHLQKARVTLDEVVSNALELVAPVVEAAHHQIHVSLPEQPVVLNVDLTRMAQVFGNLLTNAAKYTREPGHIWLTATVEQQALRISFKDNGVGIPSRALPHVFEMFSQVDRSIERVTGGLGIGLALVKGLVEAHEGSVQAESDGPGAGSTFTVCLPLSSGELGSAVRADGASLGSGQHGGRKVLVAEDNLDGAAAMADLLRLLGNEVHLARDGVEAVEIAERVRPELVLMDIGMPRLSGLDAAREIRARAWGNDVILVALTGWGQESDRERSRAAGFDGHLVKPIKADDLARVLAALPRASSG